MKRIPTKLTFFSKEGIGYPLIFEVNGSSFDVSGAIIESTLLHPKMKIKMTINKNILFIFILLSEC